MVLNELKLHQTTINKVIEQLVPDIEKGCELVKETILNGRKILLAGNGGSAADAQHIAAEFTGRFVKERKALPAIALTVDTSALTAISNDYGFANVFSRQINAYAQENDLFIAISTSGNSENIISAIQAAKKLGCKIIGLSGRDGGQMNEICDLNIVVPDDVTARIQEMHILIGHIFCKAVDDNF
ncbi:D-sedoheptulose 7-phosphate isomerase [Pedobacter glucosidilyticus]|uniref:D-sedoheptulose 7-phosphate isomerase n=1 Tax=Pedobacter glucosidilyticus TaxID=1122941 RepID=UPI0026EBF44B|nr:D-sedoheptulose 7-phosphate isomerase [Pedobacter glucosidilyticus]